MISTTSGIFAVPTVRNNFMRDERAAHRMERELRRPCNIPVASFKRRLWVNLQHATNRVEAHTLIAQFIEDCATNEHSWIVRCVRSAASDARDWVESPKFDEHLNATIGNI